MRRAIETLVAAVDMTAQRKEITLPNGEPFEFYATPLTAAERERAMKDAGSGSDSAQRFGMALIVSKCVDGNGQKMFAPGEAARLRHDLPSSVIDDLMLQVIGNTDDDEEEEADATPKRKGGKTAA